MWWVRTSQLLLSQFNSDDKLRHLEHVSSLVHLQEKHT
jgi:hypothetical protein